MLAQMQIFMTLREERIIQFCRGADRLFPRIAYLYVCVTLSSGGQDTHTTEEARPLK